MRKTVKRALVFLFIFALFFQMNPSSVSARISEEERAYREARRKGSFDFQYTKPTVAESVEFWMFDPENPANKRMIPEGYQHTTYVPNSWRVSGKVVLKPTYVLDGTGSRIRVSDNPSTGDKADFKITATGKGNEAYLTYTLESYQLKQDAYLGAWQSQQFNYAAYYLNGGKWADPKDKDLAGIKDGYYQIYITPYGTVYKPQDPVREGYTFLGWYGESKLLLENNRNPRTFNYSGGRFHYIDDDSFYQFDEIDPNIAVGYIRGRVVDLFAAWAKNPELEVKDVEIWEGDPFNKSDFIVSSKDYNGKSLNDTATFEGETDNTKYGTYPVKVTVTDDKGAKVTKTANLIVKKRWTPIEPAPTLEVADKEITVGEDFDPNSLIVEKSEGQVTITPPEGYNKDKPGTYTFTITLTNKIGAKVIKTASLTVKQKWAPIIPAPVLDVKDVEIFEGDPFNKSDLIVSSKDYNGKSLNDTATFEGETDNTKYGTYPVKVTVTDDKGAKVTKTANLIVKKRWTPIEPAPTLEVADKEITVGEDFDPNSLIVKKSEGQVTITPPEGYNKDKPGTYTFTITLTNKIGAKVTKTASLTVKQKWAPIIPAPVLEVKDVEIWEGDPFNKSDLIVSSKDYNGKSLNDTATFEGETDNTKYGTYPVKVTVTDDKGAKVTKTANLIVKKKWTPIVPAPTLKVTDKEITVGDDFDPNSLIVEKSDGQVTITPPEGYSKDKVGTYTFTITVTDKTGAKITKTAALTVKPKSVPKPDDPKPTDPTKPDDPKPTDPTKPDDPKPTDPTKPDDPKPSDPTKPADPGKPSDPTKPKDPTKPSDPTKPADPTKPTKPVKPGKTTTSKNSAKTTTKNKKKSPKTGDFSLLSYGALSLVSLAGLAVVSKKRED